MTRKSLSLKLPLTKKWLSNHTGLKWGRRGGQGLDTPSPPLAKLLCCELLVLHWLSPLGKSYEGGGGGKSIFNCVELGGGGGGLLLSTSSYGVA